jgi:hypothetical protein
VGTYLAGLAGVDPEDNDLDDDMYFDLMGGVDETPDEEDEDDDDEDPGDEDHQRCVIRACSHF